MTQNMLFYSPGNLNALKQVWLSLLALPGSIIHTREPNSDRFFVLDSDENGVNYVRVREKSKRGHFFYQLPDRKKDFTVDHA